MTQIERALDLFGIRVPIIQAPMAGHSTPEMAIAVMEAGGLGSVAGALCGETELRAELETVRAASTRPLNLNFFCHDDRCEDDPNDAAWLARLAPYYRELALEKQGNPRPSHLPAFGGPACSLVEEVRPEIVSFHFGLPSHELVERVKRTGAKIISSATTVQEARWLEDHGADAVIAMGAEAGGHRGSFLTSDMDTQVGTLALVPQIVDALAVPVIAAGGIVDARGLAAALALGAGAVQIGTAYLFTPEARVSPLHRRALESSNRTTAITNVFTGRPARSIVNRLMTDIGPMASDAPRFPRARAFLAPFASEEADPSGDFVPLWAGQAFSLAKPMSAAELTTELATGIGVPGRDFKNSLGHIEVGPSTRA